MYRREVKAVIAVAFAVIALAFLMPGCGKLKNQGAVPPNFAPEVFLANIPIDSSAFLANPEIHWYATDRDGYITKYRYKVVTFDDMPKNDGQVCPDCYIETSKQNNYAGWTVIVVADVPVSTSGTIRLFASENPDSFVSQCFFIQAEDNFGARSDVVFRVLKRANHVPDTRVQMSRGPFIAGTCSPECTQISGILVQWEGSDLLDYPGRQPDFEYEWNVYGPFDGETVNDSTMIVDTAGIIWDDYLVDHSWNRDSTDVWTTQTSTSLSRLFRGSSGAVDSTLSGYFVFKVRTRDDAYAPDPTPAISSFEAIQPACERGILVIDNSHYNNKVPGQLWGDCSYQHCDDFGGDLTTDRYFPYWKHVVEAAGYSVDTIYHRLKGSPALDIPPARDLITRYKLVILVDEGYYQFPDDNLSWFQRLADFMDIGGKVMIFGRNQFEIVDPGPPGYIPITSSNIPLQYFTLEGQYGAAWIYTWVCYLLTCQCEHSNEEFIGAGSLVSGLPDIRVDFDRLGETYGGWAPSGCDGKPYNHDKWKAWNGIPFTPYPYRGIPAVNVFESSGEGEGLYLAYSVYGNEGAINGGICGVRYDTGCFKSAIFSFPLYEINEDDAIELLRGMIDWFDIN